MIKKAAMPISKSDNKTIYLDMEFIKVERVFGVKYIFHSSILTYSAHQMRKESHIFLEQLTAFILTRKLHLNLIIKYHLNFLDMLLFGQYHFF